MTETRCEFSHVCGSAVRELDATVVVVVESVMVIIILFYCGQSMEYLPTYNNTIII